MGTEAVPFSDDKDIVNVVNFCLSLYKRQLEVPQSTPSQVVPVSPEIKGQDAIYELSVYVKAEEKWSSRRMSISTLGEGSGSKSKCFKVIYDNLLVVKIPPSPIEDFDEYIKSVGAEARIAVKLSPKIEFVAPGVSAILKKIHTFPDEAELSAPKLERKYVIWLKENPNYQEFLKIENAFAFFMDLSKYYFLSYLVELMHNKEGLKSKFRNEILSSQSLLWDILGFEGKYGSKNLSICFDMNRVYSDYEARVRALVKEHSHFVSPYEKQKWFAVYLAEREVKEEGNVPPAFISDLNKSVEAVVKDNQKYITAYKKAIWDYASKSRFMQNKIRISRMITNIIDLLASLEERGVAIRDLKPDNLFVISDSSKSVKDTSLGLIDFETAVRFKSEKIGQPLPAGTPSYSTPSHMFRNRVLKEIFEDLPRILHFQDWQASIGMIYNVATGECLFENTRKLISKITSAARKAAKKKQQSLPDVFRKGSRVFWGSAINEFEERMKEQEEMLKSMEVEINKDAQEMLLQAVVNEKNRITGGIRNFLSSQDIFAGKKNFIRMFRSPLKEIIRYKTKWEKGEDVPKTSPDTVKKIIKFLNKLEDMKARSEEYDRFVEILDQPVPKISAHELMTLMFGIVLNAMYREEWGKLSDPVCRSRGAGNGLEATAFPDKDTTVSQG
ncbi:hypothetical protein QUF80_12045 [Desulfococcaceae bacterium HSG8]|nr:hypothetical protein [Desulfococcaceae bacterium HSG8]